MLKAKYLLLATLLVFLSSSTAFASAVPTSVFKPYACGENSDAISTTSLNVNEFVVLAGHSDMSECIIANDGGKVYSIQLTNPASNVTYDYTIQVDAQGPSGFGSGNMYLGFTDQTGDCYELKVWSSSREQHEVSYNSDKPDIVKIEWNNDSVCN